jgi:hypothetical protein
VPIPKRSLFNGSCLFRHIGFLGVKIGAKSDIMKRPETLFFLQKPLPKVVVKAEQKLVVVLALLTVPTQRPQKQVVV